MNKCEKENSTPYKLRQIYVRLINENKNSKWLTIKIIIIYNCARDDYIKCVRGARTYNTRKSYILTTGG